jgi:hypothetical protein
MDAHDCTLSSESNSPTTDVAKRLLLTRGGLLPRLDQTRSRQA